jgi:hypothetical protein
MVRNSILRFSREEMFINILDTNEGMKIAGRVKWATDQTA